MAEIFTPFLTAFILAYALRPVCLWLEKHRLPRGLAAALAVLFGLGLIFFILSLFIGLLKYEIPLIRAQIPNWINNTQTWLGPKLTEMHINFDWASLKVDAIQKITEHINENADTLMSSALDTVLLSSSSVIAGDRKSTRLNSSHIPLSRMPSSA